MRAPTVNSYRLESITQETIFNKVVEKKWIREVEIIFTGEEEETNRYQVLCYALDFQSDTSLPGFNLIKQVGYIFDDVRLSIDKRTGKIVKVNNIQDIIKRWKETSKELSILNQGAVVENYFKQIETLLNSEDALICFLSEYKMYGLYFNEMLQRDYLNTPIHSRVLNKNELIEEVTMVENWKKPYQESKEKDTFIFTGKILSDIPEEIQKEKFKYEGIYIKNKKNILSEGWVSLKNETKKIQYSLLWIG